MDLRSQGKVTTLAIAGLSVLTIVLMFTVYRTRQAHELIGKDKQWIEHYFMYDRNVTVEEIPFGDVQFFIRMKMKFYGVDRKKMSSGIRCPKGKKPSWYGWLMMETGIK